jgi:hypothetical protein
MPFVKISEKAVVIPKHEEKWNSCIMKIHQMRQVERCLKKENKGESK